MSDANEIMLYVTYGLGAKVSTAVSRQDLAGCSVRDAIEAAIKSPRAPGPEERAALVIVEALRSKRALDVEVSFGPSEGVGRPVALDDRVDRLLAEEHRSEDTQGTAMEQELHFALTEPYRGGADS